MVRQSEGNQRINRQMVRRMNDSRIHVGVSVEFADVKRLTNHRWISVSFYSPNPAQPVININTRHRANTSMYSLTFCVRFLLPESHQRKPAVQATAVMLRTPPVDGQSPASQPRPLPIYGAQFWELPPSPASHRPAARAHPAERSHYVVISRDGRKLVTRVRVMLP